MLIRHVSQVSLSNSALPLKLNNVLHVPDLKYNLLSVQKLYHDNNSEVGFDSSFMYIKDKPKGIALLQSSTSGDIYTLLTSSLVPTLVALRVSGNVWHRRLGHCASCILWCLIQKQLISSGTKFTNKCVSCKLRKAHRLLFFFR